MIEALVVVWVLYMMPTNIDEIVAAGGNIGGPYSIGEYRTEKQCLAAAKKVKDKDTDAWCKKEPKTT
jgi:hypothetical protein